MPEPSRSRSLVLMSGTTTAMMSPRGQTTAVVSSSRISSSIGPPKLPNDFDDIAAGIEANLLAVRVENAQAASRGRRDGSGRRLAVSPIETAAAVGDMNSDAVSEAPHETGDTLR